MVKDMTQQQLIELVGRLKSYTVAPQTLAAKLRSDGDTINPRSPANAKKRALYDSI